MRGLAPGSRRHGLIRSGRGSGWTGGLITTRGRVLQVRFGRTEQGPPHTGSFCLCSKCRLDLHQLTTGALFYSEELRGNGSSSRIRFLARGSTPSSLVFSGCPRKPSCSCCVPAFARSRRKQGGGAGCGAAIDVFARVMHAKLRQKQQALHKLGKMTSTNATRFLDAWRRVCLRRSLPRGASKREQ